jgi:mRNA interferase RelE/StbE
VPSYRIEIEKPARKFLRGLDAAIGKRVLAAIMKLEDNPRPMNIKRLHGQTGELLRLRVSDYRIIYRVEDQRLVVVVIDIGHRREVYR